MKALYRIQRNPNIHPILMGIFSPLFLLAHNIVEIPFKDGHRSLLVIFIGAVGLLLILNVVLKNQTKAALITTLLLAAFFSYGHVYLSIKNFHLFGFLIGRSRFLFPAYIVITIIITLKILRQKEIKPSLTLSLNAMAFILFVIPLGEILLIQAEKFYLDIKSYQTKYQLIDSKNGKIRPDIYYIILDGYPRDDILLSTFGYDNSKFLDWLDENNFYVARCSQSNYSSTKPSMAATFNMAYLGNDEKPNHITFDEVSLISMIENSKVQKTLEIFNYKTITFETGYKWLKWSNPDYHFSAFSEYGEKYKLAGLNGFEVLLIKTTLASILFDRIDFDELLSVNSRKIHQARILFTFEKLSEIPDAIPGPKFIYAHVTSPHPPYIFGSDGKLLANKPRNEIVGYRDQINHINTLVMKTVDEIIQRSETSPIIIIQGDHGAAMDYDSVNADVVERLAILNAYRLPGADTTNLYPTISPVNTFKLIFSSYFSEPYEHLDDVSVLGNNSPFQQLKCDPTR